MRFTYSNALVRRWSDRKVAFKEGAPRVLIVDDNENAADAMAMLLSLKGMNTRTAFGGLQAIAMAIDWVPDVVLLDISMPDVDGFAVATVLRADWRTEKIVILAFTAHDERDVNRKASNVEFDGYCQKGQAVESLVDMLEQLFA